MTHQTTSGHAPSETATETTTGGTAARDSEVDATAADGNAADGKAAGRKATDGKATDGKAADVQVTDGQATDAAERARVLAVCRSNWEYRGIDDASTREMLAELSAHLDEAAAAGRSARDVVGADAKAFAAAWARARAPLHQRVLRMAAMIPFVLGSLLLLTHLLDLTLTLSVEAPRIAFYAVILVGTAALEIRRGSLGFRWWLLVGLAGVACAQLTSWLAGDGTLFRLPLWGTLLLMLPGLPYAYADTRARRAISSKT
ncbi:hypothetical protein ABT390_26140 [Streptomyces aurantiacus]|uniref:Uncharacterized protein n=1 Tax=Streptomyces aurantiacus JA 4570 TaxID=1286094 RepID=S3ZKN7_9ACTN|nr:hypothetical protein [Streptomyces aurantiacus]EPH43758.1 hypothetical protein STRAU_3181 [Streptomyces aurantiacus JA 4570]